MTYRAGFTGTRDGMTDEQYDAVLALMLMLDPLEVHHGDCVGADEIMHGIARGVMPIVIHPPTKGEYRAFCDAAGAARREPKDYLERDRNIVDETDYLIATPKTREEEHRSGTWYTIRYARRKRRPVFIVWPDGDMAFERMATLDW